MNKKIRKQARKFMRQMLREGWLEFRLQGYCPKHDEKITVDGAEYIVHSLSAEFRPGVVPTFDVVLRRIAYLSALGGVR